MTLTDLEKLEALHAAAPPGEWAAERTARLIAVGEALHSAFPSMAKALREAWEISKCRRDEGLDWVQAAFDFQRERDAARRERDAAIRLGDERLATLWDEKKVEIAGLTKERDAARAELAKVKESRDYDAKVIPDLLRELEEAKLLLSVKIDTVDGIQGLLKDRNALLADHGRRLEEAIRQRDDARAEATRLREQVDWLLEGRRQEEQRLALEIDERERP